MGRTYVRELLKKHAYEMLHRQKALKHRVPEPVPANAMWGMDTTCITDANGQQHMVIGIVDHGTRLNISMQRLKCFNTWTLLRCVLMAAIKCGKPDAIKLDNHPVHHAAWFKTMMRYAGIRICYTQLASPWQNGYIERLFGTLKERLYKVVVHDADHLDRALCEFRFWYNSARPHQHLNGATPTQVWHGIDPYRQVPKHVRYFEAWDGRLRGWVLRH